MSRSEDRIEPRPLSQAEWEQVLAEEMWWEEQEIQQAMKEARGDEQ